MRYVLVCALLLLSAWPSTSAAAALDQATSVTRVLELTNAERAKAGLPPLALSSELNVAAQSYTQVLASSGCFDHTCGPVPAMADRLGQAGYTGWTSIGENIAAGYRTPEAVVEGWMSSPGHRSNILSPTYTEVGIGVVSGSGALGTYWTTDFGNRTGAASAQAEVPQAVDEAPPIPDEGE